MSTKTSFSKLLQQNMRIGNQLCVGIDPDIRYWPKELRQKIKAGQIFRSLIIYGNTIISLVKGKSAAIKFQSAYFEAFGSEGIRALSTLSLHARKAGLYVILDAKRCDINETLYAYGRFAFDYVKADALTIVPYMGFGAFTTLAPWLAKGKCVYFVLLSSNQEGLALQNAPVRIPASTSSMPWNQFAFGLLQKTSRATNSCHKNFGIVVGATTLSDIDENYLSELATHPLLLPGVGAQGAPVGDKLARILAINRTSLVPISRGLSGYSEKPVTTNKEWSTQMSLRFDHLLNTFSFS